MDPRLTPANKIVACSTLKGQIKHSKLNVSDFKYQNISNSNLTVSSEQSYEDILESVLKGSGQKAHMDVVALNVSLVLWAAGIEENIEKGFQKALFSMSKAKPWDKFLRLKAYLEP